MITCRSFKLGKSPARVDARTLKFRAYLAQLPPTPVTRDWTTKVPDWLILANDVVGDCTCAAAAHLDMLWTSWASTVVLPTDAAVLAAYTAITGYNPADPSTDTGANELDVLNYWRQTGILGRKITAYVQLEPRNLDHIKAAINLFGGVYAGVQLPDSAMREFDEELPWSDVSENASDGHAIPLVAYDADTVTCITWGRKQVISNTWLAKYLDEGYAVLSPDWIAANALAPSGFDLPQLTEDLKLVS